LDIGALQRTFAALFSTTVSPTMEWHLCVLLFIWFDCQAVRGNRLMMIVFNGLMISVLQVIISSRHRSTGRSLQGQQEGLGLWLWCGEATSLYHAAQRFCYAD
jgi:hypothetical protein